MSDPDSCACGATINPLWEPVDYVIDELLPEIVPDIDQRGIYLPLVLGFLHQALDLSAICDNPRSERPRDFSPFDWVNPAIGADLVYRWLRYKLYEVVCVCSDCPPVTTCGTGECVTIGPDNGYYPDPTQPAVIEYQINGGEWYVQRADAACLGPYAGLYMVWHVGGVFDPTNGVCVGNFNQTGLTCWSQNVLSGVVTACTGGEQGITVVPWPPAPTQVAPLPGPPVCSPSDICTALEYVYEQVRNIAFLTEVVAGPLYGLTTPIAASLPGITTTVTGTLFEVLPRLFTALAPIAPSQLANPEVSPITESSIVDVTNLAYVTIVPTAVPAWMGAYGASPTRVYHSRTRSPSPGYVLILGQDGILAQHGIVYDQGIELPIPSTATSLLIHLEPGVEIDVTTYGREV